MEKEEKTSQLNLMLDAPLINPSADLFCRWPFAKRIADTISNRTDPNSIVIGIYGSWGEGKSTVLNFIQQELKNESNIVTVRFNPWYFVNEGQLILSFFNILAKAFKKSLFSRKSKIGKYLEKYGSIAASLPILNVIGQPSAQVVTEIGKQLSETSLDDHKTRIQTILKKEAKRIVVLIDDIDRLDKLEINAVFKLVKLTADFDYTAYILAFDDKMVSAALQDKYASAKDDGGERFLEKIIQVPLNLPRADELSLRKMCFQCIDRVLKDLRFDLNEEQAREFSLHFIDGLQIRLTTPRMCKMYANALAFSLPILKGEVYPIDLMLIEGIRIFYPHLYAFVKANPDIFVDSLARMANASEEKKLIETKLNEALSRYNQDENKSAWGLLKTLFPRLKERIENTTYGPEWETKWNSEKRIVSRNYFQRYFTYAISENDVSDLVIEKFIGQSEENSISQIAESLHGIVKPENAEAVVLKLRYREDSLSEAASTNIAKAIAVSGSIFPDRDDFLPFTAPRSQACILISMLLLNIPKGPKRCTAAEEILLSAETLIFAVECLSWMHNSENKTEQERSFSKDEESNLFRIVAKRIKLASQDDVIYLKYGKESPSILEIWNEWGDIDEVKAYLLTSFDLEKKNVIEFLKTYLPTGYEIESRKYHPGELQRKHIDSIAKVIDLSLVYERLKAIFGEKITKAKDTMDYLRESVDEKVAFQFAAIFNQIEKEKSVPKL